MSNRIVNAARIRTRIRYTAVFTHAAGSAARSANWQRRDDVRSPLSSKWKKNQWLGQMKQRGQEMKSKTERDGRQMDGARRNGAELDSFRLQTVAIHI